MTLSEGDRAREKAGLVLKEDSDSEHWGDTEGGAGSGAGMRSPSASSTARANRYRPKSPARSMHRSVRITVVNLDMANLGLESRVSMSGNLEILIEPLKNDEVAGNEDEAKSEKPVREQDENITPNAGKSTDTDDEDEDGRAHHRGRGTRNGFKVAAHFAGAKPSKWE